MQVQYGDVIPILQKVSHSALSKILCLLEYLIHHISTYSRHCWVWYLKCYPRHPAKITMPCDGWSDPWMKSASWSTSKLLMLLGPKVSQQCVVFLCPCCYLLLFVFHCIPLFSFMAIYGPVGCTLNLTLTPELWRWSCQKAVNEFNL